MHTTQQIQHQRAEALELLFDYLKQKLEQRFQFEFHQERITVTFPDLTENDAEIVRFMRKNQLTEGEIMLLLLALTPVLCPTLLEDISSNYLPDGGQFSEFGGVKGKSHRGIIPTVATAVYLFGGTAVGGRSEALHFLWHQNRLIQRQHVFIEPAETFEPATAGRLMVDSELQEWFLTGKQTKPTYSQNFPASRIATSLDWDDLVLGNKTMKQISELEIWLQYHKELMEDWGMGGKIKPGYRVMFCGPPGTGKTLTASLLGKSLSPARDVYRVDLSMVVSKFIGETEKNLSGLFEKAKNKDWILFFDEADAIFGKRTNVKDAHDKYANQEVSYLLQKIEAHPGLVILATNFKSNIDPAFTRRFQSIVDFELPTYEERVRLWKNNLPDPNIAKFSAEIVIEELAQHYQVTGANIANIMQYACLQTLALKDNNISLDTLNAAIKKEYQKEGKTLSRKMG